MDVREKLVELLAEYFNIGDSYAYNLIRVKSAFACGTVGLDDFEEFDDETVEDIASYLIDNGVTMQEWISVEEHLPQENEPEGAICEQVQVLLDNGVVSTGWCNRRTKLWWHLNYGETDFTGCDYEHTPVIAWKPLAQPPKGE